MHVIYYNYVRFDPLKPGWAQFFLGEVTLAKESPANHPLGSTDYGETAGGDYPEDLSEVMDFSSYDLRTTLRLIVLSGETRRVDVVRGSKRGSMFIREGEIYRAVSNEAAGDEAFFDILSWEGATHADVQVAQPPESNLRISTEVLLDLLKEEVSLPG